MTDRCKTNDAVDRKLGESFEKELNSLRCSMHPLDGMAIECEKVVMSFEATNNINDYPFKHRGETNTKATVRCTAKLFHDPQFNCRQPLVQYLKTKCGTITGETVNRSVVYHRMKGSRFHIYFLNSGLWYHYHTSIQEFFATASTPGNAVQQSIANAIKIDAFVVTTRALGIIGKVVTGPWMRLVGQDRNIFELNKYYAEAQQKLQSWAQDADQLLGPNHQSLLMYPSRMMLSLTVL